MHLHDDDCNIFTSVNWLIDWLIQFIPLIDWFDSKKKFFFWSAVTRLQLQNIFEMQLHQIQEQIQARFNIRVLSSWQSWRGWIDNSSKAWNSVGDFGIARAFRLLCGFWAVLGCCWLLAAGWLSSLSRFRYVSPWRMLMTYTSRLTTFFFHYGIVRI